MVQVRKSDGRTEPFISEKIVVAAVKSGAKPMDAMIIANEILGKCPDCIESSEIRKIVLEKLRLMEPEWENNWLQYDRDVKRRT